MKLSKRDRAILSRLMDEYMPECEIWACGSRVHGQHLRPFSDLDLVIKKPAHVPFSQQASFIEALEDSDISIRVDVSKWNELPAWMPHNVAGTHEVIRSAPAGKDTR